MKNPDAYEGEVVSWNLEQNPKLIVLDYSTALCLLHNLTAMTPPTTTKLLDV